MTLTKKLLMALIATILLTTCFGATVSASELDTVTTLDESNMTNAETLSTDNNIDGNSEDTSLENEVIGEELSDDNMDLLLQEGYYLDEQGELCYEESIEEAVEESEDTDETTLNEKTEADQKPAYTESDLRLLTCLIYSEAGNQNYKGMLAVANVVLNRAKSDVYWHVDTIEEVIYDRKWSVQFAVTVKGKKSGLSMLDKALKVYGTRKFTSSNPEAEKKALNKAIKAAKAALEGTNNIENYLCFQNKRSASRIKKKFSEYTIIDDHIFYRTK